MRERIRRKRDCLRRENSAAKKIEVRQQWRTDKAIESLPGLETPAHAYAPLVNRQRFAVPFSRCETRRRAFCATRLAKSPTPRMGR